MLPKVLPLPLTREVNILAALALGEVCVICIELGLNRTLLGRTVIQAVLSERVLHHKVDCERAPFI